MRIKTLLVLSCLVIFNTSYSADFLGLELGKTKKTDLKDWFPLKTFECDSSICNSKDNHYSTKYMLHPTNPENKTNLIDVFVEFENSTDILISYTIMFKDEKVRTNCKHVKSGNFTLNQLEKERHFKKLFSGRKVDYYSFLSDKEKKQYNKKCLPKMYGYTSDEGNTVTTFTDNKGYVISIECAISDYLERFKNFDKKTNSLDGLDNINLAK